MSTLTKYLRKQKLTGDRIAKKDKPKPYDLRVNFGDDTWERAVSASDAYRIVDGYKAKGEDVSQYRLEYYDGFRWREKEWGR